MIKFLKQLFCDHDWEYRGKLNYDLHRLCFKCEKVEWCPFNKLEKIDMTDVFKKVYKQLRPSSSELILEAKNKAEELLTIMDQMVEGSYSLNQGNGRPGSRELAIAKTNLEQALMWFTKSVVICDEAVQEAKK